METIFWCISPHTEEPSQAPVTTVATTPRKATKRNANRYRKSQRAHRGAPRYYVRGVLVAHCHRCNITHPMGQHLPSITTRLTLPDIRKAIGHSPPARPNLNLPEQERVPVSIDNIPDSRESLGKQAVSPTQQKDPNSNMVLPHLSTQLKKDTQPTEIKNRFKRNSARRKRKDGSRIYRGPGPITEQPTAITGSS